MVEFNLSWLFNLPPIIFQIMRDKRLQAYDFGPNNIRVYNQSGPLAFKVENIGVPVGLFSSLCDSVASPKDVDYLRKHLRLTVKDMVIGEDIQFSHGDFIFGLNAHILVYPTVLKLLKIYNVMGPG